MTLINDLAQLKDDLIRIPRELGHPNYIVIRIKNKKTDEDLVEKVFKMVSVKVSEVDLQKGVKTLTQLRRVSIPNIYTITEDHTFEVLEGPDAGEYDLHDIVRDTIDQKVTIRSKSERR